MFNDFSDIRSRIDEEPSWYDDNGTPRYGEFHPDLISSIYATEVSLIDVMCSICFKRFSCAKYIDISVLADFAISNNGNPTIKKASIGAWDEACDLDLIKYKYMCKWDDDPPNHISDGCHIGSCSLSMTLGVIQYWIKNQNYPVHIDDKWCRDALKEDTESTRMIKSLAYSRKKTMDGLVSKL